MRKWGSLQLRAQPSRAEDFQLDWSLDRVVLNPYRFYGRTFCQDIYSITRLEVFRTTFIEAFVGLQVSSDAQTGTVRIILKNDLPFSLPENGRLECGMSAQFKECRTWNTKGGVESQDEGNR